MICDKTEAKPEDRLLVDRTPDARISLKTKQKQFCTANEEAIVCNKPVSTNDELFKTENNEDGSVSLKCSNQKYMSVVDGKIKCISVQIGDAEKFWLIVADDSKEKSGSEEQEKKPNQVRSFKNEMFFRMTKSNPFCIGKVNFSQFWKLKNNNFWV